MDRIGEWSVLVRGVIAGAVATAVLSVMMVTPALGHETGTISVLDGVASFLLQSWGYEPIPRLAGWLWHFVIGTVWWGSLFSLLTPILPGSSYWVKGLNFGIGAGALMLLMVLPLGAAGHLAPQFTFLTPVLLLLLHMVYGVVLGGTYGWMVSSRRLAEGQEPS